MTTISSSPHRKTKVVSLAEAVATWVEPSCCLAVGGMHMHNNPMALVREIIRQRIPIDTLITSPEEPAFLMYRLYGAKPELWEKKWKLGDPELVK